jgi:prophage regulatory protein
MTDTAPNRAIREKFEQIARSRDADRVIRDKELRTMVPYSSMHIWRLEKAGRFPARIRLGPNRVGWSLREVSDWLDERKAERLEHQGG